MKFAIAVVWCLLLSRGLAAAEHGTFPVPQIAAPRTDVKPFEYVDVGKKIPNYTPGEKWGVQGEPNSRMQLPLPAEEAAKHIRTPEGFRVELFASDPDIGGKPIAITWDERGRLWIAETYDYPNELQPSGQGRDRIRVCEDTNGDGRADKFTVFAEQLSIPTSITFSRGGVIVFDGTQTLWLRDTDGDLVADERRVLFGTWSQGDTHGGPSNMQYGLDNFVWATQGYNDSRLRVGGQEHRFRQGFLRFLPDASRLEFVRSTDNNTWGLGISEEGLIFGSTANHNPSVFMPIPNRYYEAVRGWTPQLVLHTIADTYKFKAATEKLRQMDHFGGYTAAAGHALYTARRYPREYWNRVAFVCEPTGHLVGTFVLDRAGSGFRSSNPFNLAASDDEWSAPIMAEVGPDGNVWVLDWYNYIVQHNPTPIGFKTGKGNAYETDLRDKKHGRVYRIVYDPPGAVKPEPAMSLVGATSEQLVAALKHSNLFWRRHAQRLLVERGNRDVVPALIALARDEGVDEIGLNVGAIHALWTLHGLGALEGHEGPAAMDVATAALRHSSAGVRRNAVQVLPLSTASTQAILTAGLVNDTDPMVRLAALLALADQPPAPGVAEAVLAAIQSPENRDDQWIQEAAICAAAKNSQAFLNSLVKADIASPQLTAAVQTVAEHRARSGPFDTLGSLLTSVHEAPLELSTAVVRGLAKGWPKDRSPKLTPEDESQLLRLAERLPSNDRSTLVQMAVAWGSGRFERLSRDLAAQLQQATGNEEASVEDRLSAARSWVALRPHDIEVGDDLLALVTPRTPLELSAGLFAALRQSEAQNLDERIAAKLPELTPAVRSAAITLLLSRPTWTARLLDAIDQGKVQPAELSLADRQALAAYPDKQIAARAAKLLKRGGALPNPDRQKVLAEWLSVASEHGDTAEGKSAFVKHCSKCHVHGDVGQRVGPNLTGMAVHTKEELLSNILDPSRSVEGNFRVYTVATADGRVVNGLLTSESKTAIEIIDGEGQRKSILREDIDSLAASNKSLMPEGFEKQLTRRELADLLAFLTARGKYLPLALDKVANTVSTRGMFNGHDAQAERLVFDDWKPKQFAGIPFQLLEPGPLDATNCLVLYSPLGKLTSQMPKRVSLPLRTPAKALHLLSGVSGWGHPLGAKGSVSVIIRLNYADGTSEEHPLRNGEHFADYIRRVDVPGSQFAFDLHGRQLRYLSIMPKRSDVIDSVELVKGPDDTAPVVMALTVELP